MGDGGAIALAESLMVTLLMSFRFVRATLFLWPGERNSTGDVLSSASRQRWSPVL